MRPLLMLVMVSTVAGWLGTSAAWAASSGDEGGDATAPAYTQEIGCRASERSTPLVIGGNAIILGGLSKEQLTEVQRRELGSIEACYANELATNPALAGKLEFRFNISTDGRLSGPGISEDKMGADHGLRECIVAALLTWKFPELEEGHALVSLPLLFAPPKLSCTKQH